MAEEKISRNIPIHKLKVYVHKTLPNYCPFCNGQLVPAKLKTNTGKLKHLDMATCKRCNKRFATPLFYSTYENNIVLENPEQAIPLIEARNAKLEARKKRREEKEVQKKDKKKTEFAKDQVSKNIILEMIRQEWNSINGFDLGNYSEDWKKINFRPSVFGSLFVMFLVRVDNDKFRCFAISSVYRDVEIIESNTTILHVNSGIAQELLNSIEAKQTHFEYQGKHYNVAGEIALKENDLAKRVGKVNLKKLFSEKHESITETVAERSFDYSKRECVYVYFRLTNTCVRCSHVIETVTTKTINAKTGEPIEVNVFHCLECDRYFINYEALQEYILKDIFPAFNYSIVKDASRNMNEASQLMLYGYNVREGALSGNERQSILSWIIDSGLMTKAEIIKDLQFKVRYNGRKVGNENARMKWQNDIQFISQYVKDNTREIHTEFVSRK